MSTQNQKPRTWEILYEAKRGGDEFIRGPATAPNEFVKVIEYSAFQKAVEILKEIRKLKLVEFPSAEYIKNEMGDLADKTLRELGALDE